MGLFDELDAENYWAALGWVILYGIILCAILAIAGIAFGVIGFGSHMAANAEQTAEKELSPSVLLAKYRWFIQEENAITEIDHNIHLYENQLNTLKEEYNGTPRSQWAADDRIQADNLANAVTANKQNFNAEAEKYNAAMRDFSYRFTNVATLPPGETVVLNREYVTYKDV